MDLRRWRSQKQVEEMEFAEMKMLRFAMGVTKKDKIRNKYIRDCSQGRTVRNENEGGQAEVVWTCYKERPRVCRKKNDENGVTGKEEKQKTKEKISRCREKRYGELMRRRWTLKIGRFRER